MFNFGQFSYYFCLILILLFYCLDKISKNSDLLIFVQCKVKAVLLSKSNLQHIVIEALLRHAYHWSSIFKRVSHELFLVRIHRIWHDNPIIQLTPYHHFFNHIAHSSFPLSLYFHLSITLIFISSFFFNPHNLRLHEPLLLCFL